MNDDRNSVDERKLFKAWMLSRGAAEFMFDKDHNGEYISSMVEWRFQAFQAGRASVLPVAASPAPQAHAQRNTC